MSPAPPGSVVDGSAPPRRQRGARSHAPLYLGGAGREDLTLFPQMEGQDRWGERDRSFSFCLSVSLSFLNERFAVFIVLETHSNRLKY